MDITVEGRSEEVISGLVQTGRYASAAEFVDDMVRQHLEEERTRDALRAKVQAALEEGGEVSEEELDASLAATMEELRLEGY